MARKTDRVSMTLDKTTLEQIDALAAHLSCTRSALVNLLLAEQIPNFKFSDTSPDSISRELTTPQRLSGDSVSSIEDRFRELLDGFEMYQ
jgi:hypothetical protein